MKGCLEGPACKERQALKMGGYLESILRGWTSYTEIDQTATNGPRHIWQFQHMLLRYGSKPPFFRPHWENETTSTVLNGWRDTTKQSFVDEKLVVEQHDRTVKVREFDI